MAGSDRDTNMSAFPERLQRLREQQRKSRVVLSELCGLSPDAIRRYERGEAVPTLDALIKIARIATGTATDDGWVDLAGYAACGGEIASRRQEAFESWRKAKADAEAKQKAVEDAMLKEAHKAYDLLHGLR